MEKRILPLMHNGLVILIAGSIYALAVNWLFEPNQIVSGGATGIGQIIHRLFPIIPVGMVSLAVNIPLFILLARKQGLGSCFASLCAVIVFSVLIDVFSSLFSFSPMENTFLACVYAGILIGAAVGMGLRINVTTGGTDLAARLLKYRYHHISIGKLTLTLDLMVISVYALVNQTVDSALYGIISMYVCSVTVDAIVYGLKKSKMAIVIGERNDELVQGILSVPLGVTKIPATGAYSGAGKEVLLVAFHDHQIAALKRVVTEIDPGAFMIFCNTHDVLGLGFGTYSEDEL